MAATHPHVPPPAEADAFDAVLDRLVEEELDALRVQDVIGRAPTFDEIFAFYRAAGLVARKQYTLFTGRNSAEGFVASRQCFRRYYRALVLLYAAGPTS